MKKKTTKKKTLASIPRADQVKNPIKMPIPTSIVTIESASLIKCKGVSKKKGGVIKRTVETIKPQIRTPATAVERYTAPSIISLVAKSVMTDNAAKYKRIEEIKAAHDIVFKHIQESKPTLTAKEFTARIEELIATLRPCEGQAFKYVLKSDLISWVETWIDIVSKKRLVPGAFKMSKRDSSKLLNSLKRLNAKLKPEAPGKIIFVIRKYKRKDSMKQTVEKEKPNTEPVCTSQREEMAKAQAETYAPKSGPEAYSSIPSHLLPMVIIQSWDVISDTYRAERHLLKQLIDQNNTEQIGRLLKEHPKVNQLFVATLDRLEQITPTQPGLVSSTDMLWFRDVMKQIVVLHGDNNPKVESLAKHIQAVHTAYLGIKPSPTMEEAVEQLLKECTQFPLVDIKKAFPTIELTFKLAHGVLRGREELVPKICERIRFFLRACEVTDMVIEREKASLTSSTLSCATRDDFDKLTTGFIDQFGTASTDKKKQYDMALQYFECCTRSNIAQVVVDHPALIGICKSLLENLNELEKVTILPSEYSVLRHRVNCTLDTANAIAVKKEKEQMENKKDDDMVPTVEQTVGRAVQQMMHGFNPQNGGFRVQLKAAKDLLRACETANVKMEEVFKKYPALGELCIHVRDIMSGGTLMPGSNELFDIMKLLAKSAEQVADKIPSVVYDAIDELVLAMSKTSTMSDQDKMKNILLFSAESEKCDITEVIKNVPVVRDAILSATAFMERAHTLTQLNKTFMTCYLHLCKLREVVGAISAELEGKKRLAPEAKPNAVVVFPPHITELVSEILGEWSGPETTYGVQLLLADRLLMAAKNEIHLPELFNRYPELRGLFLRANKIITTCPSHLRPPQELCEKIERIANFARLSIREDDAELKSMLDSSRVQRMLLGSVIGMIDGCWKDSDIHVKLEMLLKFQELCSGLDLDSVFEAYPDIARLFANEAVRMKGMAGDPSVTKVREILDSLYQSSAQYYVPNDKPIVNVIQEDWNLDNTTYVDRLHWFNLLLDMYVDGGWDTFLAENPRFAGFVFAAKESMEGQTGGESFKRLYRLLSRLCVGIKTHYEIDHIDKRKAVECGPSNITPTYGPRTFTIPFPGSITSQQWEAIAREADRIGSEWNETNNRDERLRLLKKFVEACVGVDKQLVAERYPNVFILFDKAYERLCELGGNDSTYRRLKKLLETTLDDGKYSRLFNQITDVIGKSDVQLEKRAMLKVELTSPDGSERENNVIGVVCNNPSDTSSLIQDLNEYIRALLLRQQKAGGSIG